MKPIIFGLDLAKNIFQLLWIELTTGEIKHRHLKRDQLFNL